MAKFTEWTNGNANRLGAEAGNWSAGVPVDGDTVTYNSFEAGATPLAGSQLPLSMPAVNPAVIRVSADYTLSASGAGLPQNLTSFTGQGDATWDVFEIRDRTLQTPLGAEILSGGTLKGDDEGVLDSASPVTTAGDCTIDWADLDIFGGLNADGDTITHLNGSSASVLTCDVTGILNMGATEDTGVAIVIDANVTLAADPWCGNLTHTSGAFDLGSNTIHISGTFDGNSNVVTSDGAVIHGGTITDVDNTGSPAILAINSTNGGGNTNITFVTSTYNLYVGRGDITDVDFDNIAVSFPGDTSSGDLVGFGFLASSDYTLVLRPEIDGLETPDTSAAVLFRLDNATEWVGNVPDPASNITVRAIVDADILVNWYHRVIDGAIPDDFVIAFGTDETASDDTVIVTFTGARRYTKIISLVDGTRYFFKVTARASGIESPVIASNGVIADGTAPDAPLAIASTTWQA